MSTGSTRRGFLRNLGLAAGAFGLSRLPGAKLVGDAEAADAVETPALFILNMIGGYNALFSSAQSFQASGNFGVTGNNILKLGTDLYLDKPTLGTLSPTALASVAAIGVNHGQSAHTAARASLLFEGSTSRLIKMSGALGGNAPVRCVTMGDIMPEGTHTAVGDVSLQQVRDLRTTLAQIGVTTDPDAPARDIAAYGIDAAQTMSRAKLVRNVRSGAGFTDSYPAAAAQLRDTVSVPSYSTLLTQYGITGTGTAIGRNVPMQIMGAEIMIRAGANVVIANSTGWDSHGDNNGNEVRTKMNAEGITAALNAFTRRALATMPGRNVVTVIIGDFARSLPGSNHQPNLTATVFGKYVKLGTTGKVDADVNLPAGTPGVQGLWSYLAAVLKAPTTPFGANPHALVL